MVIERVEEDDEICAVLRSFIKLVVRQPAEVRVRRSDDAASVTYTVLVAAADAGYVIGKAGRTSHALRVILWSCAKQRNLRLYLDIQTAGFTPELR